MGNGEEKVWGWEEKQEDKTVRSGKENGEGQNEEEGRNEVIEIMGNNEEWESI